MKNSSAGLKRILVVEDEPAISDVCQRVLTGEGFEVDIAVDGKVAQDMIGEKQYDLCLIDIRTPAMNGKKLLSMAAGETSKAGKQGDIHYWRRDERRHSEFSGTNRQAISAQTIHL